MANTLGNPKLSKFQTKLYIPKENVNTKIQESLLDINKDMINVIFQENIIYQIENAEILIADYLRLRSDFDYFKDKSDLEINNYLLQNCAVMSKGNFEKKDIMYDNHEHINLKLKKNIHNYYRPPNYGRSLVFVDEINKIEFDMKGCGVNRYFKKTDDSIIYNSVDFMPSHRSHKSGCFPLGEGIEEYFNEHNIRNIIKHNDIMKTYNVDTLKSYGIIKLNISLSDNEHTQICIYLRQTVNRHIDLFDIENRLKFSTIFSSYGIGSHAKDKCYINLIEYINVQGSKNINFFEINNDTVYLIDFSGYYYYQNNDNLKKILENNCINYVIKYISDYILKYVNKNSNLKYLFKTKNLIMLEKLATKANGKLNKDNILDIYQVFIDYYHELLYKLYKTNIGNVYDLIQFVFNKLYMIFQNYWFKSSLTDCESLKEFCESGMYDVDIRKKLLEKYGTTEKATNLSVIIENIGKEYSEMKYKSISMEEINEYIFNIKHTDDIIFQYIEDYTCKIFIELQQSIDLMFEI
jgi:hypothetical protein